MHMYFIQYNITSIYIEEIITIIIIWKSTKYWEYKPAHKLDDNLVHFHLPGICKIHIKAKYLKNAGKLLASEGCSSNYDTSWDGIIFSHGCAIFCELINNGCTLYKNKKSGVIVIYFSQKLIYMV